MVANTPNRLTCIPFNGPGENPFNIPAYVSARALANGVAESVTVPAGAAYMRLAATCNVFANYTGTAVVAVDTDDGTAGELFPSGTDVEWRIIPPAVTSISLITGDTAGGIVTVSFYTN